MIIPHDTSRKWDTLLADTKERLAAAAKISGGSKIVKADDAVALLEAVIRPFDRVNIEGDNQKQADFLAEALCAVDPAKVHDLHMVQSVLTLDEHIDVRKGHRQETRPVLFRPAVRPHRRAAQRRQDRPRRHPHLS